MGKLDQPVSVNWAQLIATIVASSVVAGAGSTVSIMVAQANTTARIEALETKTDRMMAVDDKLASALSDIDKRLARIEGQLTEIAKKQ
jgi:septal ring factor EnvC (AmiA/AmiB activator)